MSHQIDLKTSACTMAGGDDDDWVYIDGDQERKASPAPAPAPVCASDSLDESEHCALDLKLLADLDYLTRKKDSLISMDVHGAATEVVATADAVGDGAVDDVDAVEDEDDCSDNSNGGHLGQVDDKSERREDGTSDLRLRGLLDNLKTFERKLLDCHLELLDYCRKTIQDHQKVTPLPAPAPSAHGYNAHHSADSSSYSTYDGKSSGYGYCSGGYGTSSGYDANGYGGGLSDYDYGGGRGGYYRGISGYDYGDLGYYGYLLGYDYGMGSRGGYGMSGAGGYGIGSGYRYGGISDYGYRYGRDGGGYGIGSGYLYGGGRGYGGLSDYGYGYGRDGGHYSGFDYGGLGDRYNGSSGNSYGYRPEGYGHGYLGDGYACDLSCPAQPAGSQYGYMDLPRVSSHSSVVTDAQGAGGGA